jgi:hypothetical protein
MSTRIQASDKPVPATVTAILVASVTLKNPGITDQPFWKKARKGSGNFRHQAAMSVAGVLAYTRNRTKESDLILFLLHSPNGGATWEDCCGPVDGECTVQFPSPHL